MLQATRLEPDLIYRYPANGLTICGTCANARAWPENYEVYGPLMAGRLAGCEYCGRRDLPRAGADEPPTVSEAPIPTGPDACGPDCGPACIFQ